MIKNLSYQCTIIIISIITNISCQRKQTDNIQYKGILTYKINYLQTNINSTISKKLLPQKMVLEFDNNYSVITLEGFIGFFKLVNIINFKTKRCTTILEILGKKYLSFGEKNSKICCFDAMKNMRIIKTGEKTILHGLNATKAIIQLPDEIFEVYYTTDIGITNPNFNNDYKDIDGVLLDFRLKMEGTYMHLKVDKFEIINLKEPINIKLPDRYTVITRKQMNEIMKKLLN